MNATGVQKEELAVSLVCMALQDGGADVSSENIDTMLKAAGNWSINALAPCENSDVHLTLASS